MALRSGPPLSFVKNGSARVRIMASLIVTANACFPSPIPTLVGIPHGNVI